MLPNKLPPHARPSFTLEKCIGDDKEMQINNNAAHIERKLSEQLCKAKSKRNCYNEVFVLYAPKKDLEGVREYDIRERKDIQCAHVWVCIAGEYFEFQLTNYMYL